MEDIKNSCVNMEEGDQHLQDSNPFGKTGSDRHQTEQQPPELAGGGWGSGIREAPASERPARVGRALGASNQGPAFTRTAKPRSPSAQEQGRRAEVSSLAKPDGLRGDYSILAPGGSLEQRDLEQSPQSTSRPLPFKARMVDTDR